MSSLGLMSQSPIVTVKEARKILGKSAKNMSDIDISSLIAAYDEIATLIIRNYTIPKDSVIIK